MAIAIKHIDQIAREKQRTVLSLEFHPEPTFLSMSVETDENYEKYEESERRFCLYKYENDKVRDEILENLTKMNVPYEMCGHFASENFSMSYKGQIYLDVPLDHDLPLCKALHEYLEYPDGSMRFPQQSGFIFGLLILL